MRLAGQCGEGQKPSQRNARKCLPRRHACTITEVRPRRKSETYHRQQHDHIGDAMVSVPKSFPASPSHPLEGKWIREPAQAYEQESDCFVRAPECQLTEMRRGTASFTFGSVNVSTPSSSCALILSRSILPESVNPRA